MSFNQLSTMPIAYRTREARRFARLLRDLRRIRVVHDTSQFFDIQSHFPSLKLEVLEFHIKREGFSFSSNARNYVKFVVQHRAGSKGGRQWGDWRNIYVRGYQLIFGLRVKVFEQFISEADFRCVATEKSHAYRMLAHAHEIKAEYQARFDDRTDIKLFI